MRNRILRSNGIVWSWLSLIDADEYTNRGNLIYKVNHLIYYACPIVQIIFISSFWSLIFWVIYIYCVNYSILIIFVLIRLNGFIIIECSSNFVLSLTEAIRFIAQSI